MAGYRVRKETRSKRPKHCVRAVCRRNLEMKWRTKRNLSEGSGMSALSPEADMLIFDIDVR